MPENPESLEKFRCDSCKEKSRIRATCVSCARTLCCNCMWGLVFNPSMARGPSYVICKPCQERSEET